MKVIEIDTNDRRQVNAFLELPFRVYRDLPNWTPPLQGEARRMLDRRRNPYFKHSEAAIFMAVGPDGGAAGRLAVLDNRRYNDFNREQTAFFYLFECENRPDISQALFASALEWACRRGRTCMWGPKGFSVFDGMGLLVKGFEHRPAFGIPYNPDYYPALIEGAGFEPAGDTVSGYLAGSCLLPEKIHRASEIIQKRRGLTVTRFRTRGELRRILPNLQKLYNNSLEGTEGNVPLTGEEVRSLADQLLWFADPRLIKILMKDGEPVGFLFAYPDISAALQRTRGRLFPVGWLHLLLELKRTRWININGAGIIEKYRGLGGTAILFSEMYKSVTEGGFEHADLVQIGVENGNMQRELRELGIDFYKTHRLYRRNLL